MITPDEIKGEVHSVNVLRQLVKVMENINDEKELREYPVDELKFRLGGKKGKGKPAKRSSPDMNSKILPCRKTNLG